MSDLVVKPSSLTQMPTSELRSILGKGLTLIVTELVRLSEVWRELENRGEDLSEFRKDFTRNLPLIASGRLAAEAVVSFAGRPIVLRYLDGVPLSEQRRLADGAPIPVYLPGEDDPQSLPISRIPSEYIPRVLGDGIIRTPAEQRMVMRSRRKKEKPLRRYNIIVDKQSQTITIGKMTVAVSAVLAALTEASGGAVEVTESTDRPARTIAAKVTDEEKERIEAAAKAHDITMQELVRRAVFAMWLI